MLQSFYRTPSCFYSPGLLLLLVKENSFEEKKGYIKQICFTDVFWNVLNVNVL